MAHATQVASVPDTKDKRQELVLNASYETFALVLVVLQVINGILWLILPEEQARVVIIMALSIGTFLTLDASRRLYRATSRRQHLRDLHGWLLLLGSLPLPLLALLRLLWSWLMIRRLRRADYEAIGRIVTAQRARSALLIALLMAILVLEIGGILILRAEYDNPDANIESAGDALWWILVTIATVGYGDAFPVTSAGRVIGVAVLVVGVALFSVLTSFLAQWFLRPRMAIGQQPQSTDPRDFVTPVEKLDALAAMMERIAGQQQAELAALHARLDELEERLNDNAGLEPRILDDVVSGRKNTEGHG